MVVSTSSNKVKREGNGFATEFPFPFYVLQASHVKVYLIEGAVETLLSPALYQLEINSTGIGGKVVFPLSGPPLESGKSLLILREVEIIQPTLLENQTRYYGNVVMEALDYLCMVDQQLKEQADRGFYVSPGSSFGKINVTLEKDAALMFDGQNIVPGPNAFQIAHAAEYALRAEAAIEQIDIDALQALQSVANWRALIGMGDGVQTVFTLPHPVSVQEHLTIWFDGLMQHSGFTVSGVVLTFAEPPLPNVEIFAEAKPGLSSVQVGQMLAGPTLTQTAASQAVQAAQSAQISAMLSMGSGRQFATYAEALAPALPIGADQFCLIWVDETQLGQRTIRRGPGLTFIRALPDGVDYWTPEDFGAAGDMTFNETINGPVRAGGSNDLAAFKAADLACLATGKPVRLTGNYFLDIPEGERGWIPAGHWKGTENFDPILWIRHPTLACAIWQNSSYSVVEGVRVIAQNARAFGKPANHGHLGSIVLQGDFMTATAQPQVVGAKFRGLVCRAPNVSGQPSSSNIMVQHFSNVRKCVIEAGAWLRTNVVSSNFYQSHWGAHVPGYVFGVDFFAGDDPTLIPDDAIAERYTPQDCTMTFLNSELDCIKHSIWCPWFMSEGESFTIGPCNSVGARQAFHLVAGDEAGGQGLGLDYTIFPGMTLTQTGRIGLQRAREVTCNSGFSSLSIGAFVSANGTSKVTEAPGTSLAELRQIEHNITFEGIHLHVADSLAGSDAIGLRNLGVNGSVDLGDVRIQVPRLCRAIASAGGRGTSARIHNSRGAVHIQDGQWDRLRLETAVGDMMTAGSLGGGVGAEIPATFWEFGTHPQNVAAYLHGRTLSVLLSEAISWNQTTIQLPARTFPLFEGTEILINGQIHFVTAYALAGQTEIEITPARLNALAGDPVVIRQRAIVNHLNLQTRSGRYGLFMRDAVVRDCQMSDMLHWGQYAVWLERASRLVVNGGTLPMGGMVRSDTPPPFEVATFRVNAGSELILNGVYIPDDPNVTATIRVNRTGAGGTYGRALLANCIVENPAKLLSASDKPGSIELVNTIRATGTRALVTIADL